MPLFSSLDPFGSHHDGDRRHEMDSNSKKREMEHTSCQDMINHQVKRLKSKTGDYNMLFLQVLSCLTDDQKKIVKKLGFGSILQFSCSSNINDIFEWLINYIDTSTGTLKFKNGFTFTVCPSIVHKILGLPFGSKPLLLKSTDSSKEFIKNIFHMENPSVEYLFSLIKPDLDEASFSLIFMLLVMSAFVAPDGNGFSSPLYYHSLIKFDAIQGFDWCTFAFKWLMLHIKKFQSGLCKDITEIGGCKIILVITYFEFLITSEFSLGISVPRLPLWTTHVVNSYIALDSFMVQKKHSEG